MGDRNQLQNALTNLAVNAEDAMPMGGILTFATETVDIGDAGAGGHAYLVAPGRYFKFSLSDTGMGMDAATLAKAFEPFFTTKDKGKGTGLGLSSVYGTIKSHNGYIELISEAGKGTRAEIHLPCTRNAELKPSERQRGILKGQGAILFVDDEEMVREMASEAIKELGYSVVTSSDGQDALNYYRSHAEEIDLTILDIIMPHMGGYECFKAMKAINPKLKVIVCSGYVINNEARKMLHQGAVGFIQKPFSMKTLEKALQTALQS
jgi:CheY-like chemotaxis protein